MVNMKNLALMRLPHYLSCSDMCAGDKDWLLKLNVIIWSIKTELNLPFVLDHVPDTLLPGDTPLTLHQAPLYPV